MSSLTSLQSVGGAAVTDIFLTNTNVPGVAGEFSTFLTMGDVIAPAGVLQISSFAFDYEGDNRVTLSNEITDHWVEDNTSVQDHIATKPIIVNLRGKVSELSFSIQTSSGILATLASVESAISRVPAYLGKYTPGTTDTLLQAITQVQNITVQIEQGAARLQQLASYFQPGPQRNKQQQAFAILSALANARVLFTVYTPFQVFYNMAITDIDATQSANSKTISDFSVGMKQLKLTNTLSQAGFQAQYAGRAVQSFQSPVQNAITTGLSAVRTDVTNIFTNTKNALTFGF